MLLCFGDSPQLVTVRWWQTRDVNYRVLLDTNYPDIVMIYGEEGTWPGPCAQRGSVS